MKKKITLLILFLTVFLCAGSFSATAAAGEAEAPGETETGETEAPAVPDGWKSDKSGKKQYYKNGTYVTGIQKIDKKTYFFDKNGYLCKSKWCKSGAKVYRTDKKGVILKKKWVTIKKKKYYLDAKGVRASGVKKIGKKRYYFTSGGVMKTGTVKAGKTTYYLDEKGVLEAFKKGGKYYHPGGKKMSKTESGDYETLLTARKLVKKITKPKMSKKQKLKACFNWVIKKPYRIRRTFRSTAGWPALNANDHFKRGGGDCHADGAAFAYLARALGYKKVYVCNDSKGTGNRGHCWAEVNGKVYDPLFAEAKNYKKYYGATYKSYRLRPVIHVAISPYLK